MQLITSLADVNPDWLTDVLRRASVLGGGSVADIAPEVASTSFCTIARLRATYSPDGACPERLSLKFSLPTHPVSTPESGAEVLFYRDVAPQMSGPLARCLTPSSLWSVIDCTCCSRTLFHPAWQWDTGHHPNIWWNHLERIWGAFDDLQCAELLDT